MFLMVDSNSPQLFQVPDSFSCPKLPSWQKCYFSVLQELSGDMAALKFPWEIFPSRLSHISTKENQINYFLESFQSLQDTQKHDYHLTFLNHFFFLKKAHEHRTVQHITEESWMVPLDKWQWVTQRWQYIHTSPEPDTHQFWYFSDKYLASFSLQKKKGNKDYSDICITKRTETRSFQGHRWDCTVSEHQVQEQHICSGKSIGSPHQKVF